MLLEHHGYNSRQQLRIVSLLSHAEYSLAVTWPCFVFVIASNTNENIFFFFSTGVGTQTACYGNYSETDEQTTPQEKEPIGHIIKMYTGKIILMKCEDTAGRL